MADSKSDTPRTDDAEFITDSFDGNFTEIAVTKSAFTRQLERELAAEKADAERYRWLRTAGAWESEIGMDALSENPDKFDAAVDAARSAA